MKAIESVHRIAVYSRRINVLTHNMAPLLPANASVLDVGCGDGMLTNRISQAGSGINVEGLDTLIRGRTYIPVSRFDGARIPRKDKSVDVVSFIDVLHHTMDPLVLLSEAKRVSRRFIVIKDHTREGFMASATLRFMDWVGNSHHGVPLPYNYWSLRQWRDAFEELEMSVEHWNNKLDLYPAAADWLFGRSLHFITRLKV